MVGKTSDWVAYDEKNAFLQNFNGFLLQNRQLGKAKHMWERNSNMS
jgi:hypothetical protein